MFVLITTFIFNSEKLKTTQMSFSGWIVKQQWYIHTMEYHSAIKKEETIDIHNNLSGSPENYTE